MDAFLLDSLSETLSRRAADDLIELEGMEGPAKAAALVDLYQYRKKPLVLVCPEEEDVNALARDLRFFLGEEPNGHDFLGQRKIMTLLPDDISPYESRRFLPSRIRQMELLAGLYALSQPFRPAITLTTASALIRRYIPKRILERQTEYLLAGADIDRDQVLARLVEGGYNTTPIVEDPGSFAARGGIVDVYSPLYGYPIRLDFFGDTLESIRLFDPQSQKSKSELEEAYLIPVREIVLSEDVRDRGRQRIRDMAREQNVYDRQMQNMLVDLDTGLYSPELDPYLPLFYEEMAPLFAYLSSDTRLVIDRPTETATVISNRHHSLLTQAVEREHDEDLTLAPSQYLLEEEEVQRRLSHLSRIELHGLLIEDRPVSGAKRFHWEDHSELKQDLLKGRGRIEILDPLIRRLNFWLSETYLVLLVAHTEAQARRMMELIEPYKIRVVFWEDNFQTIWPKLKNYRPGQINCIVGPLKNGQIWTVEKVVLLTETDVFGERKARRPMKKVAFDKEVFLTSLDEISEGDFIVHVEFGIGVYNGLVHMEAGGVGTDFLHIDYLGGDKLYLPITRLEKVQKYSGAEGNVPNLDRLGGTRWAKVKLKVKAAIREMAGELLKLYAKRKLARGYAFSKPDAYFAEFEASFPYEETRDQQQAIDDVLRDMQKPTSMDRLICGDVGFGKTEVALRAAFKAVMDHKQVAILVPTTVLALQHGESFAERLKDYPVIVETLSRFKSTAEQKKILERAATGQVDILIGTHRLLGKDVKFSDLGLLVIDEEQRFGVTHKEKLKKMREEMDILTMTATPIPRTLNMALSGVRNISIIRTPPMDRLSIRTYVSRFEEETIAEAITNELSRGGQVFFVHNRVGSIEAMAAMIKRLVPRARIAIAHGQMSESQLESVMLDFIRHRTNVLVTTTIIESGIDIPTVNTMIVNRADCFGLSQLYQLRGRVGRGRNRAYAYLLVPSPSTLTRDAQKRLSALIRFTELGSGFRIASHDMEIRGAGNLLGKQQSGHIATIGIDLYFELIDEAVRELKGEQIVKKVEPQINIYLPAYLPNSYIIDPGLRLHFYKRLSSSKDDDSILSLIEEMEDRFGRAPAEVLNLAKVIELKVLLKGINAAGLDLSPNLVSINLGEDCTLPPDLAIKLATRSKRPFQLTPDMKLIRSLLDHEKEDPIRSTKNILQELIDCDRTTRRV